MARKRRNSIVHQVSQALTEINLIGTSKKEARKKNQSGIHSIKQVKATLSAAQNFVKWVRECFGILSVYELNETHYMAYIEYLKGLGRSAGHRQNVETSLKHLEKGMAVRSEKLGFEKVSFVPEKRITDWRELKKAENRSYSQEEFEMILSYVSQNVQHALLLERYMGLRVKEACNVLVKHFDMKAYQLDIPEGEGRGITKGGRHRKTPIPQHLIPIIQSLIQDKSPDDRLLPIASATVRKAVNRSCKKAGIEQNGRGTHGFRHLYCRDRLSQLLAAVGIETEGRTMLERIMSNRDVGRKADYGILSAHDKEIYSKLKQAIDVVHEEIGHGEDRWDLAERYLR